MMKINKFRSWNEADECFYYFVNGGYFTENGETAHRWRFNWENAEQFTGLHDKNGKEIYEGDIVQCDDEDGAFNCIIKWDGFQFNLFVLYLKSFDADIREYEIKDYIDIQIIGNIHENPELCK